MLQGGGVQTATPGGGGGTAGGSGVQDYSQQWIEYYRAQGMHAEADKIEAQIKASKVSHSCSPFSTSVVSGS